MKNLFPILIGLLLVGCVQSRLKRYEMLLEPKVGKVKKSEMNKVLGTPVKCVSEGTYDRCEYRTARERNEPVPVVHIKQPGMGPDVSPYDYFDVIHLFYDDFGVLQEWQPIVIKE